jgi:hypothetical protein
LPDHLAIVRLAADAAVPHWATQGRFFSVTRTGDELSIVCTARDVPAGVPSQPGWRALKVLGPFPLSEIGVLAALTAPLTEAQISLFVISTFDTDYVLVKSEQLPAAVAALERAGHQVHNTDSRS